MAELADALDLGSSGESRAGSSPVIRIVRKFGTFKRLTRNKSRSFCVLTSILTSILTANWYVSYENPTKKHNFLI